MKNNDFEEYISELSPDLQEKARQCKDMDELNKLIAENDLELPEDVLAAVAGGASCTDSDFSQGDDSVYTCPECHHSLCYWDRVFHLGWYANRYYCANDECQACIGHWLFTPIGDGSEVERVK